MKRIVCIVVALMFVCLAAGAGAEENRAKKAGTKAQSKTYTDPVTEMPFVWVSGGCYQMGDSFGDGDPDEKPVHGVCVDGFYMAKYVVTQAQWEKVMGSNPSNFSACGSNCPVENVSWDDAQKFISKLNDQSGKQFRLPTEAEWEYAARSGGKKEKWPGTSDENALGRFAWYWENANFTTHPVGQKQPNGLGLYDMSGNVLEWVGDWKDSYDEDFLKLRPKNPHGPLSGSSRVCRGGCWRFKATFTRASRRTEYSPEQRDNYLGFRLALPITQSAISLEKFKTPREILNFGMKMEADGEKKRAMKVYRVVVEKYPNSSQAETALKRILAIQNKE